MTLIIVPPKRPELSDEFIRLETFKNWPRDHCKTPKDMAEAGFHHTGPRDNVHCFYCGGSLRKWEPEDIPWVEHARWWPRCGHVLTAQGPEFVETVQHLNSINEEIISLEMVEQEMVHRYRPRKQKIGNEKFRSEEKEHLSSRL